MCKRIALLVWLIGVVLPRTALAGEPLWTEAKEDSPPVEIKLPSFAPVIDKLGRSVVNISIEGEESVLPLGRGLFGLPPSWPFEGLPQLEPKKKGKRSFSSLGSGFVINADGYIVTNNHVVEKATKILVAFRDDKMDYEAKVVGRDKKTDIALLKVDVGRKLDVVVLGDSEALMPGDWVIAIGNPFRFGHTATAGIVSAKSRRVPGGGPYGDFIQTDASINPGNSGGPLFNSRGEVVGINSAIFSPGRLGGSGGFNIGIGFATPINLVKSVIAQLHEKGKVTRGWLGVLVQSVSSDMAQALNLDSPSGALVADVVEDSPAEKGGMKRGDVIVFFDGRRVEENDDLPLMVAETEIGKKVKVEIVRAGKKRSLPVKIREMKEERPVEAKAETEESELGLSIQRMTPDLAKSLGLESSDGVVVTNIEPESAAAKAGLSRGDVILEVAAKAINSVGEFREATKGFEKNKPLLLLVRRDDSTMFLTLKVE